MKPTGYTDAPDLNPNLMLGSLHLLLWLIFHPAAWRSYAQRVISASRPDFTLLDISISNWMQPARRRLLIQVYGVWPVFAGLVCGLILLARGVPLADALVPAAHVSAICLTLSLMVGMVIGLAAGLVAGVLVALAFGVINSLATDVVQVVASPTAISIATGIAGSVAVGLAAALTPRPPLPTLRLRSGQALGEGVAGEGRRPLPTLRLRSGQALGEGVAGEGRRLRQTMAGRAPRAGEQAGGIVVGLLVGILAMSLVRLGLTALAGLAAGLPEESAYYLARALVVGASFGLAVGWRHSPLRGSPVAGPSQSLRAGLIAGGATALVYAMTIVAWKAGWGGIPIGLTSGVLFGTSFGVTFVLPYVLSEQVAGPWAGAWAGALGSWGRHVFRNELPLWPNLPLGVLGVALGLTQAWWRPVLLYPLLEAWNLILYRLDERQAGPFAEPQGRLFRAGMLRWHSAFWDEHQRLPWGGLDDHVLLTIGHSLPTGGLRRLRSPDEGLAALDYLRASRQRWAAQAVQIELEARRLEGAGDLQAMSQIHRSLAAGEMDGPASGLLRSFSRISQDIEAALNQGTPYHQRLALSSIHDRLGSLARELTTSSAAYASRFYPIAADWQQAAGGHLRELADAVERSQEIDNPYVVGVPLTEEQEIFVGRADIVARIEQLLLDRRRPPLLLYGQRRMGKTSLLRNLGRLLPTTIVPLFVDGQRAGLAGDYADFLYNLAQEMRTSAEGQRGLGLPRLSRDGLQHDPFTCFNEWLDQVERELGVQGYHVMLLALDEFEMLDRVQGKGRFEAADVLSLLRHMVQHRPRFKVMLAGSHTLDEFQHWASYLINMQVIHVGYLEADEARQLIERPVKDFPLQYEPEASRRVLQLTRGHPALVQLLCYEVVTLKNRHESGVRRLARVGDVEAAAARALDSGGMFFADIQQNQIDGVACHVLRALAAGGEGAVAGRETLARPPWADPPALDRALALLLRRDLIEPVDGGFRFQVELIRRWFAR